MNFFKALLLTLGAFFLIQSKIAATNFSVKNNTKKIYTAHIQNIGKTKEVPFGKTYDYAGRINRFVIQIKKASDNELQGFISVILPKKTTEDITLTVRYENETFKLEGLGEEEIIPPYSSSDNDPAILDLSQVSTEIKPSKRKAKQQYEEEDDEDEVIVEKEVPAKRKDTKKITRPSSDGQSNDEEDQPASTLSEKVRQTLFEKFSQAFSTARANSLTIKNSLPLSYNFHVISTTKLNEQLIFPVDFRELHAHKHTAGRLLMLYVTDVKSKIKHQYQIQFPSELFSATLTKIELLNCYYNNALKIFSFEIGLRLVSGKEITIFSENFGPFDLINKTITLDVKKKSENSSEYKIVHQSSISESSDSSTQAATTSTYTTAYETPMSTHSKRKDIKKITLPSSNRQLNDDEDDEPAPYSSTPAATTPAYTSSFSSTSAASSHVPSHALQNLQQQCLLDLTSSTYALWLKKHSNTHVNRGTMEYIQPLQVSDSLSFDLMSGSHDPAININIPHELKGNYLYYLSILTSSAGFEILMSLRKDASSTASSINISSECMPLTHDNMTLDIKKTSSGKYGFFRQ